MAAQVNKMVTDGVSSGDRDAASRARLASAGYVIAATEDVNLVHCKDGGFSWISNGFSQCYGEVDGKKCRILDYTPCQSLQPHVHDADELFVVKGGAIKVGDDDNTS